MKLYVISDTEDLPASFLAAAEEGDLSFIRQEKTTELPEEGLFYCIGLSNLETIPPDKRKQTILVDVESGEDNIISAFRKGVKDYLCLSWPPERLAEELAATATETCGFTALPETMLRLLRQIDSRIGIWIIDGSNRYLFFNNYHKNFVADFMGSLPEKNRKAPSGLILENLRQSGKVLSGLREFHSIEAGTVHIQTIAFTDTIPMSGNEMTFFFDIDLTEHIENFLDLKRKEQQLRSIAENTYNSEFWISPEGQIVYQSPSIKRMTGYAADVITNRGNNFFYSLLHPEDRTKFIKDTESFLSDRTCGPMMRTFRIITASGEVRWWESIEEHILDAAGRYLGIKGSSRDITPRVTAEMELRKSIKEKDLLLKEVHHRVKNNLSIVSGLIYLQETCLHDERDVYILNILKNRIESITAVHELLYTGGSGENFDLETLIKKIAENIFGNTGQEDSRIRLDLYIAPVPVDSNLAAPLGLIINEVLTNSMKYAVTSERRSGSRIIISAIHKDNFLKLTIKDNGPGYPQDVLENARANLGLLLIKQLVVQLNGKLKLFNTDGAATEIEFPCRAAGNQAAQPSEGTSSGSDTM